MRSQLVIRDYRRIFNTFWTYVGILVATMILGVVFPPVFATSALTIIMFLIAIIAQCGGVRIYPDGAISFPSFLWRQTISATEIEDINSEFFSRENRGVAIMSAIAGSKQKGRRTEKERNYCVNLSGAFGSRQIRFQEKRKRDQFLSVMRKIAPAASITRTS